MYFKICAAGRRSAQGFSECKSYLLIELKWGKGWQSIKIRLSLIAAKHQNVNQRTILRGILHHHILSKASKITWESGLK